MRTMTIAVLTATFALTGSAVAAPLKPQEQCARWASTKPMRLIVACSEVIRAEPEAAWAYLNRGIAHGAGGDSDREIADYTRALSFNPALTSALQNRGVSYFDRGDFGAAAKDFKAVVRTTSDPYAMLYLFLAQTRSGEINAVAELESNAAKLVESNGWPAPLAELYLGKKQASAVMTAASTPEQRCQLQFYIAEWRAIGDGKSEATKPLRTAAGICAHDSIEFGSALAELKRLGIGPPKPKPAPQPAAAPAAAASEPAAPAR